MSALTAAPDAVTASPFADDAPRATHKVGLIGGMSWYSTVEYYRCVNARVQAHLGGHRSARLAVESLDFEQVRAAQLAEDWDGAGDALAAAGERLEASGARAIAICTNLMHKVAPAVQARVDVPVLHIADAVADRLVAQGVTTAALLGSRWVMEEDFYAQRLAAKGVEVVVPGAADRELVDRVVFDELTRGVVTDASRAEHVRVMGELADRGAEAAVLACTEIEHLFRDGHAAPLPLVDSMRAHADRVADFCLTGH
ncbi:amino acid racemase [Janibacter melonis]|uniref:aspartate/glutamate racemase family protein n=1 Tax=Janibacter melonis TaxID=262209 RepID=UPI0020437173|nr:amino acid racemase [Janibacter melonis]MCM3554673.1 amino acid racemase [Janibacter melonis]